MSEIAILLGWVMLQVTLVGLVTSAGYFLAPARGANLRSALVVTGLLIATCLVPLVGAPWPRWEFSRAAALIPGEVAPPVAAQPPAPDVPPVPVPPPIEELEPIGWQTYWNHFVDALEHPTAPVAEAASDEAAEPDGWSFSWGTMVPLLFGLALVVAVLRLAGGYWAIRRTVRAAWHVRDREILEMLDLLQAELRVTTPVALRASNKIATAATTGWRRPVILLPADWTAWTPEQTRAVLVHELAHVSRRDFLVGGCAQLALSLHFYHPLWHWLVGRLRLEQELAADALAASVSGGRETYLRHLAELALRRCEPTESVAWPVRAFIPSRRTFLRRIEMLRDPARSLERPNRWLQGASIALLVGVGLMISGLRPGEVVGQERAVAKETPKQSQSVPDPTPPNPSTAEPSKLASPLAYMPVNSYIVAVLKPHNIINDPAFKPHAKEINSLFESSLSRWTKRLTVSGISLTDIEEIALTSTGDKGAIAVAIRTREPIDLPAFEQALGTSGVVRGGVAYYTPNPGNSGDAGVALPDLRTILFYESGDIASGMLLSAGAHQAYSPWPRLMRDLDNPSFAVLSDSKNLLTEINRMMMSSGGSNNLPPFIAAIVPMLGDITQAGISLGLKNDNAIRGRVYCKDSEAAGRVAETLNAFVTLGERHIEQLKKDFQVDDTRGLLQPIGQTVGDAEAQEKRKERQQQFTTKVIPAIEELLASISVESKEQDVIISSGKDGTEHLVTLFLPALQQAKASADRARSRYNLEILAVAFHNYHDVFGHFPPAVLEKNGVRHSWRVAILPFIEGANLYDQYKFDEPWDSENNKKILEQMPGVFRNPGDTTSDVNSTSYYLITSEHSITEGRPAGGPEMMMPGMEGAAAPPVEAPAKGKNPVPADQITLFSTKPVDQEKGQTGPGIRHISDGTSHTIMIVEGNKDLPWTKPEDISFDPEKLEKLLKEDLGSKGAESFETAFPDGTVRTISKTIDLKTLSHLITPADGNPVELPGE